MPTLFKSALMAVIGLGALQLASPALADVTVIGNGLAAACSAEAKMAARNQASRGEAIDQCTLAIENEDLSTHELAATFVNRGVLRLATGDFQKATQDFDRALHVEPGLAEAHVNRGAALIGEGHDAEGVAEIDRGLALDTTEAEKAYFNRALAKERMNDIKGAYLDYQKALALKPGWDMPRIELARFHVVAQ